MTIADQLLSINNSKLAIKASIEAKGVTVGSSPLADYAGLIDTIPTGSTASATPTLAADATQFFQLTATITNWTDYTSPNATLPSVYVELWNGTLQIPVTDFVISTSGVITSTAFGSLTVGAYELRVRVQEYDQGPSALATIAITKGSTTFRYWRLRNFVTTGNLALVDIRLYTDPGFSTGAVPDNMTSSTTPSPYVTSSSFDYNATYANWKAFDNSTTSFWWTLGHNAAANLLDWIQVDLGSSMTISGVKVQNYTTYGATEFDLVGSDTGAFAGEEVTVASAVPNTLPSGIAYIGI